MSKRPWLTLAKWTARLIVPVGWAMAAANLADWPSGCGTHNLVVGTGVVLATIATEFALAIVFWLCGL